MKHDLFVDKMKKIVSFATVEIGTLMILNQSVCLRSTLWLLVSSAADFCRQFGPRSGPTIGRA